MFSTTFYVLQNWSYNFYNDFQNTLWSLTIFSLRFAILENNRNDEPKPFVTVKKAFFWNVCFSWSFRSYRNKLSTCLIFVNMPFAFLLQLLCCLWCPMKRQTKRQKNFCHLKDSFFFKKLCFQQPRRYYRNDAISCTKIAERPRRAW